MHCLSMLVALTLGIVALASSRTAVAQGCAPDQAPLAGVELVDVTYIDRVETIAAMRAMLGLRDDGAPVCKSAADWIAAADDLQRRYGAAGFGAVRVIRPQALTRDGVLRLRVVEGRLASSAEVFNASAFSAANIRASLPALAPGQPLRLHALDAQLRLANENPGKEVQVLLKPGTYAENAVEAEIRVRELPLSRFRAGLDNTGPDHADRYRLALGWRHANLSDHDDVLSLEAQTAPEHPDRVRIFSAGYRWPIYSKQLALEAFGAYSSVNGAHSTAAGDVTLNGVGRVAGVRATAFVPRWGEFDQRLSLAVDRRQYKTGCMIAGLPEGACGGSGETIAVTPVTAEYAVQRTGEWPVALTFRLQRNVNADAARIGAVRDGAPAAGTVLRLAATSHLLRADDWDISIRATGQWSRSPLIPGEMFGAGGAETVRGYQERELTGDSGLALSLQAGRVGLFTPETDGALSMQVYGFIDVAQVRNRGGLECQPGLTRCRIASAGPGVRAVWRSWSATLDVGVPDRTTQRTTRGRPHIHVALAVEF